MDAVDLSRSSDGLVAQSAWQRFTPWEGDDEDEACPILMTTSYPVDAPPFEPEPLHNELHVPPSRRRKDTDGSIVLPIDGDGNPEDALRQRPTVIVIDLC